MKLTKGGPNIGLLMMFNVYRILVGIGVGLASGLSPLYIGEIAPAKIRGKLVTMNILAIIIGTPRLFCKLEYSKWTNSRMD